MSAHSALFETASPRATRRSAYLAAELFDRAAAILALIVLAPALFVIAAAIYAFSGMSPLIAHRRVGYLGTLIWVYKFRTMWPCGAASKGAWWIDFVVDDQGPNHKSLRDPRVTHWFARFCRRFSLDELPQLLNVARGEMSLVGPRPLTRTELSLYYGRHAALVLSIKPGLTGLWQVMGRSRLSYRQRVRLDLFLVRSLCVPLYLSILARTIPRVLSGKDSW